MNSMNNMDNILGDLNSKDKEALATISSAIKNKIKQRLIELNQSHPNIKHVQVNYFNINNLHNSTALNYADVIVKNTDPKSSTQSEPSEYMCVMIYFDKEHLTSEIVQMLLSLTSKVHLWKWSDADKLYIDELGVYIDAVNFEKQHDEQEECNDG